MFCVSCDVRVVSTVFFFLMIRRPPRSTLDRSSAASDVYKRQVYGQTELTKDLMDARAAAGLETVYEAKDVSVHDFDGKRPRVRYVKDGAPHEVECDFIAGRDGFHGVCRASVPQQAIPTFARGYPIGWRGRTDDTPRASVGVHERAARIYDGPDEVHKSALARRILKQHGLVVKAEG